MPVGVTRPKESVQRLVINAVPNRSGVIQTPNRL
jgi:hypothetical protein